jgi:WD40 repeat protein
MIVPYGSPLPRMGSDVVACQNCEREVHSMKAPWFVAAITLSLAPHAPAQLPSRQGGPPIRIGRLTLSILVSDDRRVGLTATMAEFEVWDVVAGRPLRVLGSPGGHPMFPTTALSADGKVALTSASGDSLAIVWDTSTGKPIARLPRPEDLKTWFPIATFGMPLAMSADAKTAVVGATIFDVGTGKIVGNIAKNMYLNTRYQLQEVAVSGDGKRALTRFNDVRRTVWNVWDLGTRESLYEKAVGSQESFNGARPGGRSLGLSGDGSIAAIGINGGKAVVINVKTGNESSIEWDAAAAFGGQSANMPEGMRAMVQASLARPDRLPASALVLSNDGKRLLIEGSGRVWDTNTGQALDVVPRGVATLSRDGRMVVSISRDGDRVIMHEIGSGRAAGPAKAGNAGTTSAPKTPGFLAAPKATSRIPTAVAHGALAVSADGSTLTVGSPSGAIDVWGLNSGSLLRRLKAPMSQDPDINPQNYRTAFLNPLQTTRNTFSQIAAGWSSPFSALSADGRFVLTGALDRITFHDGREPDRPRDFPGLKSVLEPAARSLSGAPPLSGAMGIKTVLPFPVALSADGSRALTGGHDGTVTFWDTKSVRPVWTELHGRDVHIASVALSPDGRRAMTGGVDGVTVIWDTSGRSRPRHLKVERTKRPRAAEKFRYPTPLDSGNADFTGMPDSVYAVAISSDGKIGLSGNENGDAHVWNLVSGKALGTLEGHDWPVVALAISPDNRLALSGDVNGKVNLWDLGRRQKAALWKTPYPGISSVAFQAGSEFAFISGRDAFVTLFRVEDGSEVCRLYGFDDGSWAVTDSEGRFDADNLERTKGLAWVSPDDPNRSLPFEVFMRDYYEPGLLRRILGHAPLPPVRPRAGLNFEQPTVEFVAAKPGRTAETVDVTVRVSTSVGQHTGVHDVRLFRDGQLVGQWPESSLNGLPALPPTSEEFLAQWRSATQVAISTSGRAERIFAIRLPRHVPADGFTLTTYAFNEDRIKSATATATYAPTGDAEPVRPRAYLLLFAVDTYKGGAIDLDFAASDARYVSQALSRVLARRGYDVIVLPLISSKTAMNGDAPATKANLRTVLRLLAGITAKEGDTAGLASLRGSSEIQAARPDDLVLLFAAGHGYTDPTDPRGEYYLYPHDLTDRTQLFRCISSAELSDWFKGVDAGELVLIVDACHAAATIDQPGFKPGPMGSRGLGQLAYDKGMRVLTATQAKDVAVESLAIRHGLLTYALVRNGLELGRAANSQQITLGGWLRYAERRVPELYREVREGVVRGVNARADRSVVPIGPARGSERNVQRPVLFDYAGGHPDLVLIGPNDPPAGGPGFGQR